MLSILSVSLMYVFALFLRILWIAALQFLLLTIIAIMILRQLIIHKVREAFKKKSVTFFTWGGDQDRSLLHFFFQKHGLQDGLLWCQAPILLHRIGDPSSWGDPKFLEGPQVLGGTPSSWGDKV